MGIVIGCVVGISLALGTCAGFLWMWFKNRREAGKAAVAGDDFKSEVGAGLAYKGRGASVWLMT